jgi:hypothetical protein
MEKDKFGGDFRGKKKYRTGGWQREEKGESMKLQF